ncbi:MAG: hypothetical protein IIU57_00040, partial [Oscillospiraceae bacterium]|nr:hypothetical protein [Oscillospiraceae bacterium]
MIFFAEKKKTNAAQNKAEDKNKRKFQRNESGNKGGKKRYESKKRKKIRQKNPPPDALIMPKKMDFFKRKSARKAGAFLSVLFGKMNSDVTDPISAVKVDEAEDIFKK